MESNILILLGETLVSIEKLKSSDSENYDTLIFTTKTGDKYRAYHEQDCCESVEINDIEGNLDDLIGSPILQAEKITNSELFNGKPKDADSFTWTFYKLATIKGYVTIRWLGESNGYYSESVNFVKL